MQTKLTRWMDGILESAWLLAVILIPLFFNIYSSRIFEPDKIAILRSLALISLGAWSIKLIEARGLVWNQLEQETSPVKYLTKFPLLLPVIATAVLYILATIFSITPRVSLLGSYQRLQGTYTTLSYIIIFATIVGNMRSRKQVERLLTTLVITSLPVALYGVLQKYRIDPVPWGGDTSVRIAANLGNSIFVAAYLIMVIPLSIGKIVEAFNAILKDEEGLGVHFVRATMYVFILALQVIALYMSGSRGPALGWMAGSFYLFLLLSLYWKKRWLTISTIGIAFALGAFLVVFNIKGGPLESLRESPAIGRFGLLLDAESNSALVRKYIWEGAADLVAPHDPLTFPDGSKDRFNFLRPLIGYGPESMYVAYNPFYIPELAQVERRNASPDRSHNETWDSLVITGFLGIIVYLALFTLVFYYALKWIGLVLNHFYRNLFLGLVVGGGILGAVVFVVWRGVEYFGVGLPFGMLLGLLLYISLVAIFGSFRAPETPGEAARSLALIVLVAGILSHFVEINFGIAIAATRTYFWVFTALIFVVGYVLPRYGEYAETGAPARKAASEPANRNAASRKRKRGGRKAARTMGGFNLWDYQGLLIPVFIVSTIMTTLGYDFIANPRGNESSLGVIWAAFTRLPNRDNALSYGVLGMVLTTWIVLMLVTIAEAMREDERISFINGILFLSITTAVLILSYWLWHAGTLASMSRAVANDMQGVMRQVDRYKSLLTNYYIYSFLLLLGLAYFLPEPAPTSASSFSTAGMVALPVMAIVVFILASFTNLRVIQADIVYKLADPFQASGQWLVAINIYDHANELAPNEDYYYLFLGRAYLEYAKTLSDANERDVLIDQAARDLRLAQDINPLNTDHTANLGRLYSLWASFSQDGEDKQAKAELSSEYFSKAVTLSPKNARLWDEWGILYMNIIDDPEKSLEKLNHAIEIDPEYHWTYALLGEFYNRQARNVEDVAARNEILEKAAQNYAKALDLPTPGEPRSKYSYALALGSVESQIGNIQAAINAYEVALEREPGDSGDGWRIEEALARLYAQNGDLINAMLHGQEAISKAPQDQVDRLSELLQQIQALQNQQ